MAEPTEYSPSDSDMSLAAPERQGCFRYFRSSKVTQRHGGGVASGSHVKARPVHGYRMILMDRGLADGPDYRKRADTPWDKNIDAQSRWKRSRTAARAYESDRTAYELVQDETTGSDVNMRTADSLGAIVRLFASSWLPPGVYAQLREASRNFGCRCDAKSLRLINSFTDAFLINREGSKPQWNTHLKIHFRSSTRIG